VAKRLTKGALVELAGRVSASAWKGKDGEAHAVLKFHTSQIKLHGKWNNEQTAAGTTGHTGITRQNTGTAVNSWTTQQDTDEDLPF
jgi:single-strand DNA-binding protein